MAEKSDPSSRTDATETAPEPSSPLARLDAWMHAHAWHPRVAPAFLYVLFLAIITSLRPSMPWTYPILYVVQCGLVIWLLWRYRHLLPEVNFRFHWTALPVGLAMAAAWVAMGLGMEALSSTPHFFGEDGYNFLGEMSAPVAWTSLAVRLLGMSIVVPIFEELLFRSLLLRSLVSPRITGIATVQLLEDMPVLGHWVSHTRLARVTRGKHRLLDKTFEATPLGTVTVFSVVLTVILWCLLSHVPRDWPATVVCGLAYTWIVWYTNRGARKMGLGPVIWAHGITNATLWGYTLYMHFTGRPDWGFL